ncbi:MAG TPA: hypothetical protein VJN93_17455 [Candidatus Acidoferrum sp.]|nr:hypothetical protein [Candidatus Acidoferrum sp.]
MSRRKGILLGTVTIGLLVALVLVTCRIRTIPPAIELSTIALATVQLGPMPFVTASANDVQESALVLFVKRPFHINADSAGDVFVYRRGENRLVKFGVRFGRVCGDEIEIRSGLKAGDQVVISDLSAWDQFDDLRVR